MDRDRTIDVSAVLENRRLSNFNYKLVIVSWLTTLFDGFDMMVISFAAPYIRDELALNTYQLGNIFSCGVLGTVLGGFALAYLGDRLGRRPTLIAATFAFGILTAATAFARSYEALLVLRFLDGIAIGGVLPIAWALNVEYAPAKVRATAVTLVTFGYSIGNTLAGPITIWLAPQFGWQGVYLFGGLGSLLCAVCLWFALPESVRFLTIKQRNPRLIARILNRLKPDLQASASDAFILGDEQKAPGDFSISQLFAGNLKWLTPLLWVTFSVSTVGIYFATNWGPTFYEQLGLARDSAAYVASLTSVIGALLGIAVMRFIDRHGPLVIVIYPALTLPLLLFLGFTELSHTMLTALLILAISLMGGTHVAMFSLASVFYPTAIRASGGGWAASVAKVCGIFSPSLGAVLLTSRMPVERVFAVLAVCPLVFVASVTMIGLIVRKGSPRQSESKSTRLNRRRFQGDDFLIQSAGWDGGQHG